MSDSAIKKQNDVLKCKATLHINIMLCQESCGIRQKSESLSVRSFLVKAMGLAFIESV